MDVKDRAFELYKDDLTYSAIAAKLSAEGYTDPQGKQYVAQEIEKLIRRVKRQLQPKAEKNRGKREKKKDAADRALDLFNDGLPDSAIAEKLMQEGYRKPSGKVFLNVHIKNLVLRAKQRQGQKTQKTQPPKISMVTPSLGRTVIPLDDSGPCEPIEVSDISDHSDTIPESWREGILAMIRAEIADMSNNLISLKGQTLELPLPSGKVKGKHNRRVQPGQRTKISTTIDANLVRELEKWRLQRSIPLGKAMDLALWHFLGKPLLSFEKSESADTSD